LAVPGAAIECTCTPASLGTLLCTIANSAMSIAKAMRVRRVARNARNVASMLNVTCEESENRRARKVTPVAASEYVSVLRLGSGVEQGTCQLDAQLNHG
jgi:hypothetical protein